jgi:hypothetical protein
MELFYIFLDPSLSLGGFISTLVLNLTDLFVSRLILEVLIDRVENIKFEAVLILLIFLVDRCLNDRLGYGRSTEGRSLGLVEGVHLLG